MRLPRFRIRTLMIAVAVVAIALCVERLSRWRAFYQKCAAYHDWCERGSRAYADDARGVSGGEHRVARGDTLAAYHAVVRRKYERAARRPWLPVPPDPPPPE